MVTKKKAEAYQIVANILGKLLLCIVVTSVFVASTVVFFRHPSWYTATPNTLVGVVILQVVRHYFPVPEGGRILPWTRGEPKNSDSGAQNDS
jgi:hypothetical protein